MKNFFADGAYDRRQLLDKAAFLDFVIEVGRRTDQDPVFKVVARRWVVERSIGWLTRFRRLVRDYEARLDVSESMIYVAMGRLHPTDHRVSFQTDSQHAANHLDPLDRNHHPPSCRHDSYHRPEIL